MICYIRFYEELNFFLPVDKRKREFQAALYPNQSVKDLIESLGIPHTEVDLILVNGNSVDFSFRPIDKSRISVYPVFESMDITKLTRLRPKPLRVSKFILDVHLGKLSKKLRVLGFDTLYRNDYKDNEIAVKSLEEKRIVLTRDRGLLKRSIIERGYIIRSDDPNEQLIEVFNRFNLKPILKPLSRCLICNGYLKKVEKEDIKLLLQPKTIKYFDKFKQCNSCGKIYWKGSHYQNMLKLLSIITKKPDP